MRILVDMHHSALYHSLHLLFEKRLGFEMYRAIGTEWYDEGFWKVYDHPHTVKQFLGLHQGTEIPMDVHGQPLPEVERKNLHYTIENGIYYIQDLTFETTHRAIRLDKFKEMEFDIILSSIPQHIQPFNQLIARFQPNTKHIFQVGNNWTNLPGVNNIMASTTPFDVQERNVVFYHQEFDLEVFKYEPPKFHNVINSYVHYMQKPETMNQILSNLPGWVGTTYGAGMQLQLQSAKAVASAMKDSAFTLMFKPGGDGMGHSIHSSYACGRPAIYWGSQYKNCLAGRLMEHMVTGIDVEKCGLNNLHTILKELSEPNRHKEMCKNTYNRFKEVVNFDRDFENIKQFLERLT